MPKMPKDMFHEVTNSMGMRLTGRFSMGSESSTNSVLACMLGIPLMSMSMLSSVMSR